MTAEKDLKRIVRARMEKTGEAYTTARRHVLHQKPDYAAVAGMSDTTILAKTGRNWAQWVELLDAFGAKEKPHIEIATHVYNLGIDGWWSQSVTVGYERIRGLRARGQQRSGSWEATKSKTFAVPVEKLFDAFANARTRKRWLGDIALKVRTAKAPSRTRKHMSEGYGVVLLLHSHGLDKSWDAPVVAQCTAVTTGEEVGTRGVVVDRVIHRILVWKIALDSNESRRVNFGGSRRMTAIPYPFSLDMNPVVPTRPVPDLGSDRMADAVKTATVTAPIERRARIRGSVVTLSET